MLVPKDSFNEIVPNLVTIKFNEEITIITDVNIIIISYFFVYVLESSITNISSDCSSVTSVSNSSL